MCKVASNSGIVACSQAPNTVFGGRTYFLSSLLVMASLAFMMTVQISWAELKRGEKVVTVTNAYWVRLRSTPEAGPGTILTRVAGGAQLKYLGQEDDWYKVELPGGREGWLSSEYGRLDSARDWLEVSASVARVRESRNVDSPVIGRAIQGLQLEILQREDSWYRVRLPLGEEGWIRDDLVTLHAVEPAAVLSGPIPEEKSTVSTNPEPVATEQTGTSDETSGVDPLSLTPLPIAASADSTAPNSESSAPTMASPQAGGGPSLLTIMLSVVAGLSVFAIFLVVGALAMRRRNEEEYYSTDEAQEPETFAANPETSYSDPLLGWMSETSPPVKELRPVQEPTKDENHRNQPDGFGEFSEDLPIPPAEVPETESASDLAEEGTSWDDLATGESLEPTPREINRWDDPESEKSSQDSLPSLESRQSEESESASDPAIQDFLSELEQTEFEPLPAWASSGQQVASSKTESPELEEAQFEPEPLPITPEPEVEPAASEEQLPETEEKSDSGSPNPAVAAAESNSSSTRSRKKSKRRSGRRRRRRSRPRKSQ